MNLSPQLLSHYIKRTEENRHLIGNDISVPYALMYEYTCHAAYTFAYRSFVHICAAQVALRFAHVYIAPCRIIQPMAKENPHKDINVYSINVNCTPYQRWHLSSQLNQMTLGVKTAGFIINHSLAYGHALKTLKWIYYIFLRLNIHYLFAPFCISSNCNCALLSVCPHLTSPP